MHTVVEDRQHELLKDLNYEQQQAIMAVNGPVLLLAGAGTGKTKALTTRIVNIITNEYAFANNILAVTFTNKAANEISSRIMSLLSSSVHMPWVGTFHSINNKILRRHAEVIGLKHDFTIIDQDDQLRLLKQILKSEDVDEKKWPAKYLLSLIMQWKNKAILPNMVSENESYKFASGLGKKLYGIYQERLKIINSVDFGDLLLEVLQIFVNHQDILHIWQKRFRYILVDEYQDTNVVQYLWLKILAEGNNNNICCVGDDDQSIYGWRGAEVDNILRFEKDFKDAKILKLKQNYRSTGHILEAATNMIANNAKRFTKELFTNDGEGKKVKVYEVWDHLEEAFHIAKDIEQKYLNKEKLKGIAILVRASFQMREFEERFITLNIPYKVIGGPRFYERAEIRDAIAYLRCVVHQNDDLAFERIVNNPRRGIGKVTIQNLYSIAKQENIPLTKAIKVLIKSTNKLTKQLISLDRLSNDFTKWHNQIDKISLDELAKLVLEESGYLEKLRQEKSLEANGRLDNLKELISSMKSFPDIVSFLDHISLVMDIDNPDDNDNVYIMTLHAAKGLEFDNVYLPGWEEGIFPNQKSIDENGDIGIEEERRLAYVGMTRAKKDLKIFFALNRQNWGLWQKNLPSRFISELPEKNIEFVENKRENNSYSMNLREHEHSNHKYMNIQNNIPAQIAPQYKQNNEISQRVFHLKFGFGNVLDINGDKITVNFDVDGKKMVMKNFLQW